MNAPLRRVAAACLLLFLALLVRANWVQAVRADALRNDDGNARVLTRAYENERGAITLADGTTVLAQSTRTEGPLTWLRTYPGGSPFAHVTGFLSLVYGQDGLEDERDDQLSGRADELFVDRLSDQVTGREPRGATVVTTLSGPAQQAAVDALAGQRGAVVALDPRTGAVLAMASAPTYDPARLSSFEPADIRAYWAELTADGAQQPLLNRAISSTYPPGSTFKVITAAAALEAGATPETLVDAPDELLLPQTTRPIRNFGGGSCEGGGQSSLADALKISCNTAFAGLGVDLGADALREQAEAFGFGEDDGGFGEDDGLRVTGPVADSAFPSDDVLSPPLLGQSAIGQFEVRVTPLQMAMVAAGIANDGEVMRPYVVREVRAPDLSRLELTEPEVVSEAVSDRTAEQLTSMMELVVSDGSGTRAQIDGVRVAGKTGTAQTAEGRAPHTWFIGFAPAEDPVVAVAVVVEEGGDIGSEATGGAVSAPIARAVMQAVLGP